MIFLCIPLFCHNLSIFIWRIQCLQISLLELINYQIFFLKQVVSEKKIDANKFK